MPLDAYGVVIARPVERRREGSADTPHFQIHAVDDGTHYTAAQAGREGWSIVF